MVNTTQQRSSRLVCTASTAKLTVLSRKLQFMPTPITREILPLKDGNHLSYSLYRETDNRGISTPLLICLHPGWAGHIPSPHYGEQFLSSIFIPAFAGTGATVVSPTCPGGAWNNPKSKEAILELLDHLLDRYEINTTQVSLVGYSAGGWGAYYLLLESAERFASAVVFATLPVIEPADRLEDNFPKCEELITGRLEEWVRKLPSIPIYMIHSRNDELFPFANAMLAYQTLMKNERRVKFYAVHGVGHYDAAGYVDALSESVPWLIDTWKS